jgi:hypothetical protein
MRDFESYSVSISADLVSYLNDAKAVLAFGADYLEGVSTGVPMINMINQTLHYQYRGSIFVHALFSSLYGVDLARISYPFSAFGMFLSFSMFRLFLPGAKKGLFAILLIGILPFNTFYQKLVFMSWTGQLFSLGIVAFAFFLECYLARRGKFDPRTCVLLVFVLTLNSLNYI